MKFSIFGASDRNLLSQGRASGPMPWVIAIMMFLTSLAAVAGLGLSNAATRLDAGNRLTIQIVQADPVRREAEARAVLTQLRGRPGIISLNRVDDRELQAMIEPWLGSDGLQDVAMPAMIEAELGAGADSAAVRRIVAAASSSSRVDQAGQWLAPLERLIRALRWLALSVVLLMAGATAATVVLAARASLDTHRSTIEVLHLMGATDNQVARLFQRRIALDALLAGLLGLAAAAGVLALIGQRISDLGSDLIGSTSLAPAGWVLLGAMPFAGMILAMLVARMTILRALSRLL